MADYGISIYMAALAISGGTLNGDHGGDIMGMTWLCNGHRGVTVDKVIG